MRSPCTVCRRRLLRSFLWWVLVGASMLCLCCGKRTHSGGLCCTADIYGRTPGSQSCGSGLGNVRSGLFFNNTCRVLSCRIFGQGVYSSDSCCLHRQPSLMRRQSRERPAGGRLIVCRLLLFPQTGAHLPGLCPVSWVEEIQLVVRTRYAADKGIV